jgi:hypothetical protein
VAAAYEQYLAQGSPWIPVAQFATDHMRPNRWVQDRQVGRVLQLL